MRSLDGARLWWAVFGVVATVYVFTATYGPSQSVDTFNTAVQARQIAVTGSPVVESLEYPEAIEVNQLREGRGGLVTDRHPGPVLVGVVGYTLARPLLPDPAEVTGVYDVAIWPAAVTASLATAAAVATLATALIGMAGVPRRVALVAAGVFAFGTGTWSVSADALWTHTVTQLGLCLAIAGLVAARPVRTGLGFALAILGRTHTALIAAAGGLAKGWERRRIGPVVVIGVLSAVGLGLAMLYGLWVFGGDPSLTVGRGNAVARLGFADARTTELGVAGNLLLMFVHPARGLLPMAPFLVPLLFALPAGWRRAPTWVRGLAIGGAAQLLVQGLINHYSGGDTFFGSRVTLEFLTATFPLWVLAYVASEDHPRIREWTHVTAGAAVVIHAVGATVMHLGVLP